MTQRKVLIVDDGEHNRIILSRCVRRAGYEATLAEDGPTALEAIAMETPDLVLLDWMMPGLSGIDTLKAIRASHSAERLPVIMCTARSASRDVQTALAAGANDFITKPIDIAVAIARIESQLQRLEATETLEAMNQELEVAVAQRTRALLSAASASAPASPAKPRGQSEAVEEILRLAKWLDESDDAQVESMRKACAASIIAAARTLATA